MESQLANSRMSPLVIQGEAGFGTRIGTSRVSAQVVIKQNIACACCEFYWCGQADSCDVSIERPHIFVLVWMSSRECFQLTVRTVPNHGSARVLRYVVQIDKTADEKWWRKGELCVLLQSMVDVRFRPFPRLSCWKNADRVRGLRRRQSRTHTCYRCRCRADLFTKTRKNGRVTDECVVRM